MLQLFAPGRRPHVEIVADDDSFWSQVRRASITSGFDDPEWERVDLRLVQEIENIVRPVLGGWERDSSKWWHNIDWNADGIRSLAFNWDTFQLSFIPAFHALLAGEHERFCILCHFYRGSLLAENSLGYMSIYRDRIVATRPLSQLVATHA